ncbi:MAG: hydantoinase/oxoprolinase N-terminal domain-containing protein, partial [Solirubrobacterales bacterium]
MASTNRTTNARIAVDIGGTFTDLIWLQGGRVAATAKTLTTNDDPARGVETGLRRLLGMGEDEDASAAGGRDASGGSGGADRVNGDRGRARDPALVGEIVHGTTLVSNALIERKAARTALLTTKGFKDVLGIGLERRYDLYDLELEMPEPLVRRRERWELDERVLADGAVDRPLDLDEARKVARRMRREGIESVAVSLLHAYRNPDHERALAEVLEEELPEVPVSLSSDVAPELGEFVRTSTVAAN